MTAPLREATPGTVLHRWDRPRAVVGGQALAVRDLLALRPNALLIRRPGIAWLANRTGSPQARSHGPGAGAEEAVLVGRAGSVGALCRAAIEDTRGERSGCSGGGIEAAVDARIATIEAPAAAIHDADIDLGAYPIPRGGRRAGVGLTA